ncbi:copper resistance protein CopC [Micromonospora sp. FIMYZ51]|uniref:copper resistance CopC family protein n=1 Tax=Micromonospora sp. FIMYZ51 TaxID=3051832 RepID=UPI00311F2D5C
MIRWRRPASVIGGTALAIVLVFAASGALRADSGEVSTEPVDGAVLTVAPSAVVLTFAQHPEAAESHVVVRDGAGRSVTTTEELSVAGRTVVRPVVISDAGDYTAAYHVRFDDGGQASGTVRFSVGTGVPPRGAEAAAERMGQAAATHQHGVDPVGATLLVVDGAVVLVVVLLLLLRPRRRAAGSPGSLPGQ